MLGKYVRVKVTAPIYSKNEAEGFTYGLNYGKIRLVTARSKVTLKAFVMGMNKPVRIFDGVVIASLMKNGETYYVVAPKSRKYIIHDVRKATAFFHPDSIRCYYERSCGAVVQRVINGQKQYLLIKNKRSAHWSFPKGHIEKGETNEETARREVLEETGTHIHIIPGFQESSNYMIQNRINKTVIIFAATTKDRKTVNQESEIEASDWLPYDAAYKRLKFENDKKILKAAHRYLNKHVKVSEKPNGGKQQSGSRQAQPSARKGQRTKQAAGRNNARSVQQPQSQDTARKASLAEENVPRYSKISIAPKNNNKS